MQLAKRPVSKYQLGTAPVKVTGTTRMDYKIHVMDCSVDKFGVYTCHLQHCISTTANYQDRATVKGKYSKLIDASVLLDCVLFFVILAKLEKFSLVTQLDKVNITEIVD